MTKSFPRTLRRAAADNTLVELLHDSPWERAMRECQPSKQAPPFHSPDGVPHAETPRAR